MTGKTIAWCIEKAKIEEAETAELLESAEERLNDFLQEHGNRADGMTDEEAEEARALERHREIWKGQHEAAEAALRELEGQDFR